MTRTTFQNAMAELFDVLTIDDNGTPESSLGDAGCRKVYDHEPGAGGWVKPCAITLSPAGIEPLEWLIALRVYVDDQYGPRAQDLLVEVAVAAGALLRDAVGYGPDRFDFGWATDLGCWVGTSTLAVGREDGF